MNLLASWASSHPVAVRRIVRTAQILLKFSLTKLDTNEFPRAQAASTSFMNRRTWLESTRQFAPYTRANKTFQVKALRNTSSSVRNLTLLRLMYASERVYMYVFWASCNEICVDNMQRREWSFTTNQLWKLYIPVMLQWYSFRLNGLSDNELMHARKKRLYFFWNPNP